MSGRPQGYPQLLPQVWLRTLEVTGARKHVLWGIVAWANASGEAWPSLDQIALAGGCSRTTTIRTLKALEADGLVIVKRTMKRNKAGRFPVNVYRLQMADNPSLPAATENPSVTATLGTENPSVTEAIPSVTATQSLVSPRHPKKPLKYTKEETHARASEGTDSDSAALPPSSATLTPRALATDGSLDWSVCTADDVRKMRGLPEEREGVWAAVEAEREAAGSARRREFDGFRELFGTSGFEGTTFALNARWMQYSKLEGCGRLAEIMAQLGAGAAQ